MIQNIGIVTIAFVITCAILAFEHNCNSFVNVYGVKLDNDKRSINL